MKNSTNLALLILIAALCGIMLPAYGKAVAGDTGGGPTTWNRMMYTGAGKPVQGQAPTDQGGAAETKDQSQPLEDTDMAKASGGKSAVADKQTGLPGSAVKMKWPKGVSEAYKRNMANTDGMLPTNSETQLYLANFASTLAAGMNAPDKQMHSAKANLDAQGTEVANGMADLEKQQAASAIDFCSSFLTNFTTEGGNKWNKLRDNIFMPMAILLLLPGAILTQVKAIIAAGTPVLGEANPFEGIQRSLIAIFLIPGTYLVLNYSIDLNNSITYSIAEEYTRLFGSNMYKDAISFHIRAFPSRQPGENRNALDQQTAKMTPLLGGKTAFALFEGKMIENKIEDPVAGIYQAPMDRADEALPSSVIMAKTMFNSTNATFMIAWNILCAFQMVYFYYLWFVGPITAALWAWPIKSLRNAFPSWVEGVITLGFWSLFWNTSILLMACFRGVDETGTLILTALNFLATSSVKYAFDFAGLAKAAGQEAASMAEKAMKQGGAGGGGGGGGGGKSGHAGAGHKGGHGHPHTTGHPNEKHAEATPGGPKADSKDNKQLAGLSLNERVDALNWENAHRGVQVASNDPQASFMALARQPVEGVNPPPVAGDDNAVRQLPGSSFTVGDGGSGGHMFTRSMVDGKPVLSVTDMDGNSVKGMDGKDLAPISLSGIPENGSRSVSFDPDENGKARGSVDIQQGNHGAQLYHASSHGHSELVAYSGGHLSGHSGAAVDSGMHAAMLGGRPAAELQPGLFYGSDGKGGGALYDIDNNQINFDGNGDATMEDGRALHMDAQADGSSLLSVNGGDSYALTAHGDSLNVNHGDATHDPYNHPINSLSMGRDANGASIATQFNDHGMRTESSSTLGPDTQRAYYNPDSQALLGSSNTHNFANGDSFTSFNRDDGSLVGTNVYQMTDDGYRETVFDGDNNAVSMQQTSYDDNGYSVTSANFIDGNVSNASMTQFDNSGVYQSSQALDSHNMQAIAGDVSALNQYANFSTGVVPDGNVFGASQTRTSDGVASTPQQIEVANNFSTPFTSSHVDVVPPAQMFDPKSMSEQKFDYTQAQQPAVWPKMEAQGEARAMPSNEAPKVLPVDIAGTQLNNKDFSQTDGAYAANNSSQAQHAEVAYSNPVVTASVDIMPPQVLDSTPMAYQQAELAATNRSLESVMAANVGGLSVTSDTSSFNFNSTQGPPTDAFAVSKESAPDIQHFTAAPAAQQVLPVDIAGTQMQGPTTEFSQVAGDYAATNLGQGNSVEVAYSNPVVTSSIDVVPPAILDSTPMAYQHAELQAANIPLESVMAANVGGLTASDTSNSFSYVAPDVSQGFQQVSRDAAPDQTYQTFTQAPQAQQVLPVDIAGTQMQQPTTEFSQVAGDYAATNLGQGNSVEVAYSNPVVTSSIDVVPPAILDSTPMAYQHAELQAANVPLESVMAANVGGLTASDTSNSFTYVAPDVSQGFQQVSRDAAPDQTYQQFTQAPQAQQVLPVDIAGTQMQQPTTEFSQVAGDYAATNSGQGNSVEVAYSNPVVTSSVDVVPPAILDSTPLARSESIEQYQNFTPAQPQQGPGVGTQPTPVALGSTRSESIAQLASAAAIAAGAQQHLLGNPKIVGPAAPKVRGLGTIFSDISKKAVKPTNVTPKTDPTAQAQAGQPVDPKLKGEPTVLMGKMRDTVDAETAAPLSTNQSLEKQMMAAGSHVQSVPASTLSSILNKTNASSAPQKPSEYLTSALVDYHTVAALIHEGKTNEAALVSGNALANISRCSGTEPQLLPLVRAFVVLFEQKSMIHQAKAFADKEAALNNLVNSTTAAGSKDNIWGS
jgi:hypothetical protein